MCIVHLSNILALSSSAVLPSPAPQMARSHVLSGLWRHLLVASTAWAVLSLSAAVAECASVDVEVVFPISSIHAWVPTAAALDASTGIIYLVDDETLIRRLSAVNGSELGDGAFGIMGPYGSYVGILSVDVGPWNSTAGHRMLWVCTAYIDGDRIVPSVMLVDGSTLRVVRNVSAEFVPPIDPSERYLSLAGCSATGRAYILVYGRVYVVQEDGSQLAEWDWPWGDIIACGRTDGEDLLYSAGSESISSIQVVDTSGTVRTNLQLSTPADWSLSLQLKADNGGRLWLIDEADGLCCFNASTGGSLLNVSVPDAHGFDHALALDNFGDAELLVLTDILPQVDVLSVRNGTTFRVLRGEQSMLYSPVGFGVDDSQGIHNTTLLVGDFLDSYVYNNTIRRLDLQGRTIQHIPTGYDGLTDFRQVLVLRPTSNTTRLSLRQSQPSIAAGSFIVLACVVDVLLCECRAFNRDGELLFNYSVNQTTQISVDWLDERRLWFASSYDSTVRSYSVWGELLSIYEPTTPPMYEVRGVAAFPAPDGTVLTTDDYNQRVVHFDANGQAVNFLDLTTGLDAAWGLAVDRQRRIFVVHCMWPYSGAYIPDYCYIRQLNDKNEQIAEYHTDPALPNPWLTLPALSADGSRLFATDINNNRLLCWDTTATNRSNQHVLERSLAQSEAWPISSLAAQTTARHRVVRGAGRHLRSHR